MKLTAFEQLGAGGVDSRSNPLAFPPNRALRCLNWVPKQSDFWELRYGYSSVTMSTVTASAIHSMFPYRIWNGSKYVLFMQGTTFKTLDTSTGTVTSPTVNGTAISSSAKGSGYFANNRFHYGNGTDQKWYDGTKWRNNGLPALTAAQLLNVTVIEATRELTLTQASTVTLTPTAGGSFAADSYTGHLIFVAIFDTSVNDIGPATISVGSGRAIVTLNEKISITNLPDLSGVKSTWVKLIGGTSDGGSTAYFFTNITKNIVSCSRVGTTLTVVATTHGLSTGDVVAIATTGNFDGVYVVTVSDANTFTVALPSTNTNANTGAVGTVNRIVKAANAATSVDVLSGAQVTSYQVNQNRGVAASTVGGANPGYQFYGSIYNSNGEHVGNRMLLGGRVYRTDCRINVNVIGLPDLSGTDSEYTILIGRTVDGGSVPCVCTDPDGNWTVAQSAQTQLIVTGGDLDGSHELPTRNGVIPAECNMFCVAGDFCYAADTGSPYLRRSGDLSQSDERGATFTGRPEQSWAPNDIDSFPTGEALAGMFEVEQEVFAGTVHSSALSVNLAGIQQWVGPWDIGIAGRRAGAKCGKHGFYWLSGDKQLCTFVNGIPEVVSEEYELAELSQIGDAYLTTVELAYYRNPAQGKDELRIEGQTSTGTPYTIIHDFKLSGQGYSSQFLGALASVFTVSQVRDGNGVLQVYAGGSAGQIYQLSSGANDAGTEYVADLILLTAGGVNRPSIPFFDFYGDANIKVTVGRTLSTSLATGAAYTFDDPSTDADTAETVQGSEQDFLYRVKLTPSEVQKLYLRFKLTSHSADGNLALNSPPHVPLENYGRLYELIPAIGEGRDR